MHRPVTYWTEATHTEVTQFFLEIHHLIHNVVEVAILQHDMQYAVSMIVDTYNINSDFLDCQVVEMLDKVWVGGWRKINRLRRLENREYGANDEDLRMRFLSVRHGWWRARRKLIRMHGLGG